MTDKTELEAAVERLAEDAAMDRRAINIYTADLRLILASHAALTERVAVLEGDFRKIAMMALYEEHDKDELWMMDEFSTRVSRDEFIRLARAALKDTQ